MLTIQEVYQLKRKNPNLTLFECLQVLQEKYDMDEREVAVFVKSNKTLMSEVKACCQRNRKIKGPKQTTLDDV